MAGTSLFQILHPFARNSASARLGRLSMPGRKPIPTPNLIASASRGSVPHLTTDTLTRYTNVGAAYMGLEDFIERKDPPIYACPESDIPRLHKFTCFPSDRITVLGPRRCPAVLTPTGNVANCMSLWTSTGFLSLPLPAYSAAAESLQPDIVVGPADLPYLKTTPHSKKLIRMVERTEEWVDGFIQQQDIEGTTGRRAPSVFAPVLPVELPIQWSYLQHLSEDIVESLSGLAMYDTNILPELTKYPALTALPRLSLHPPRTPRELLRQISLGMDLCTVPFINSVSDSGVAMSFTFPAPQSQDLLPLGTNMWDVEHQASVSPLAEGCDCYACTSHHRAFLQHLLNAKEMLGWNLLQVHNHRVMDRFFSGIRETLASGAEAFEQACDDFNRVYEAELPVGTGQRPRARGHHFKSGAGQEKANPLSWSTLGGDGGAAQPPYDSGAETPVVPNESSEALADKGFASPQG